MILILFARSKNSDVFDQIALKKIIKKLCILYRILIKHKIKKVKRCWVSEVFKEEYRIIHKASNNLIVTLRIHDRDGFKNFLRMSPELFDKLLSIVGPAITKQDAVRSSIFASIRLQLTLRFLATRDNIKTLAYLFRVSPSSVTNIIEDTFLQIWTHVKPLVFEKVFIEENWKIIVKGSEKEWNFPHCCGSRDDKLITMQAPPHSNSYFYDYKGHHSNHLQACVDAYQKFIMVEIGAAGPQSDGGVFRTSSTGKRIINNQMNLSLPESLEARGPEVPYIFVGDEAFGLSEYMMTPYPRSSKLDLKKKVFNYRQSRARRIVECSFGGFTSVWGLFSNTVKISLPTLPESVEACVCLHNYLIINESQNHHQVNLISEIEQVDSVENLGIQSPPSCDRTRRKNAISARDNLADYLMGSGAVPFQWAKANQLDF